MYCEPDNEPVKISMEGYYPEWHVDALCVGMDSTFFFGPDEEKRSMSPKQIRTARQLCSQCPVFEECLTAALAGGEQYGVWAGTSGRERKKLQDLILNEGYTVSDIVKAYKRGELGVSDDDGDGYDLRGCPEGVRAAS